MTTSTLETAARHSMDSADWYTPTPFVEAARRVMGTIDLDPASHAEANARIGAPVICTEADNGLQCEWFGSVFLNPPGGLVKAFWAKALDEFLSGRVTQIVWIGYSLEQLQTLQTGAPRSTPLDYPTCITAKRIAFVENVAKREARIAKLTAAGKTPNLNSSPSHSNYITYLGPHELAFLKQFRSFGQIIGM